MFQFLQIPGLKQMDRIKNFTERILDKHRSLFTDDFEENKSILVKITKIPSKQLRNKIAGYITCLIKQEKIKSEENSKESLEQNI
jgi:small subunit ribosomal protein S17e